MLPQAPGFNVIGTTMESGPLSDYHSKASTDIRGAKVLDSEGSLAVIVSVQEIEDKFTAWVRLETGQEVILPLTLLEPQENGYRLPFPFKDLSTLDRSEHKTVIPIRNEQLKIDTQFVDTGKGVRLRKSVSERNQTIDLPLLQDELIVERIPVGRIVAGTKFPIPRQEGNAFIVPVLEEVLVVEKKLYLKEEVRITKRQHEVHISRTVPLKSEQVSVERFDEGDLPAEERQQSSIQTQTPSCPGKSAG
jgi:uncharacterized protein (TIGR02271 family)